MLLRFWSRFAHEFDSRSGKMYVGVSEVVFSYTRRGKTVLTNAQMINSFGIIFELEQLRRSHL
jgi:hypothetical protein